MKKGEKSPAEIQIRQEQFSMTLQGETVLQCSLTWPQICGKGFAAAAINRYYNALAQAWRKRWKTTLYLYACLDLANRSAAGKMFRPWQAEVQTEIALHTMDILSLKQECTEIGGEGCHVFRCAGDTWNTKSAALLTLSDCTPRLRKKQILAALEEQLVKGMDREDSLYYRQSPEILRREFDPGRFWVEQDRVCIFYPPGLLGSRAEGLPVFVLPRQA